MTTELVLLLAIYAFMLLGVFLGPLGPTETFRKSAPRLAAKVERNIATGTQFTRANSTGRLPGWEDDNRGGE